MIDDENVPPFIIELEIPPVPREEAMRAAERLVGSPMIIHRKTKQISAYIETIAVRDGLFLCEIVITDEDLRNNFEDLDYVYEHYDEIESIWTLFGPLH